MKRWKTLLWLELRRSGVWAIALLGSLAFWAWGLNQVRVTDVGEQLGIRAGLLAIAAAAGVLVLCIMIGRIRSETRNGQYQILLLTPPSGYAHVSARFAFALGIGIVYFMLIGGLFWWIGTRASLTFSAGDVAQLVVGLPLYGIGLVLVPALAWTLLLMIFISAYRISGTGWIPGTVMVVGTPFLYRWIAEWMVRASYTLPSWPLLGDLQRLIGRTIESEAGLDRVTVDGVIAIPQEPLWIMIGLALLMLLAAGRIWQEVEG